MAILDNVFTYSVQLVNNNNSIIIDISRLIESIEIKEDLFGSFMHGTLYMNDNIDALAIAEIQGNASLVMKIVPSNATSLLGYTPSVPLEEVPELQPFIFKRFMCVHKIDNKIIDPSVKRVTKYQIHFISEFFLSDTNVKVSKLYKGKSTELVRRIMRDHGWTPERLYDRYMLMLVEESSNDIAFHNNYWSLSKTLKYAATKFRNKKTDSPSFVFFENKRGPNFVSLDSIYGTENNIGSGDSSLRTFHEFTYDDSTIPANVSPMHYLKILELNHNTQFDLVQRIQNGFYGSNITYLDPMTGQFVTKNYSPYIDWYNSNHLNDYPDTLTWPLKTLYNYPNPEISKSIPHSIEPTAQKYIGRQIYQTIDGYNNHLEGGTKTLQKRMALLAQAEASKITFNVLASFRFCIGDKVKLNIPKTGLITDNSEKKLDEVRSGFYIISAVKHLISSDNRSISTIECIKDSTMTSEQGFKKDFLKAVIDDVIAAEEQQAKQQEQS